MANVAPAVLTYTGTIGPGQAVTSLKFSDVVGIEVDFVKNTLKVNRSGAGSSVYYDFSALSTITWTISNGISTLTFS